MTESYTRTEIDEVISDNQEIVEDRGEPFHVDREILFQIFNNVNSFNDIQDKRTRIIKKAAHILGGITYHQPFNEGNKETALSLTISFLRNNGLNLPLNTTNERHDIYELMNNTALKFEGDPTIISEVENYLSQRSVKL